MYVLLVILALFVFIRHEHQQTSELNQTPADSMSDQEFAMCLKDAYKKHKHDPHAFARASPRIGHDIDQESPIQEQIDQCNKRWHDRKRSMYASYLARFLYGRSSQTRTVSFRKQFAFWDFIHQHIQ